MTRRPAVEPEPDDPSDDDCAIDVPIPTVTSDLDDAGHWTVAATFADGSQYTATANDEAMAALMLGVGLASIADRDDAPQDVVMFVGVIGVAYDEIAGAGED